MNIKIYTKYIWLICFLALSACTSTPSHVKQSPQYINGQFQNQNPSQIKRGFKRFAKFWLSRNNAKWPQWIENTHKPKLANNKQIIITFINHATFMAEIKGFRILFDPIFSKTAGPTSWLGAKRKRNPAIPLNQIPKIDLILISHNHYDHLDIPTLQYLSQKYNPKILVPIGDKNWMTNKNINNITELDWWQSTQINTINAHFVPAQHWSKRTLFDTNQSLWGGFIVNHNDITLFHAGDTGYAQHFKQIAQKFPKIDISMLPIGSYKPEDFMEYSHMNPSQALQAHKDLNSKISFGMHSETFSLTATSFLDAENELKNALSKQNSNTNPFLKLNVGESYLFKP